MYHLLPTIAFLVLIVFVWWVATELEKEIFFVSSYCPIYLEKEMATHSSILAWDISWTEEPGGL